MLDRLGRAYHIGISAQGLALVHSTRWGRACTVAAETPLPADASMEALAQALRHVLEGAAHGLPVSFILADDFARMWQVTPPAGAVRLGDLQAAAVLRFQTLYGELPTHWQISANWDVGSSFLACALPRALLAVLEQAAAEHDLAIVGIVPQFTAAWNRWRRALRAGAWFGTVHDGVLSLAPVGPRQAATVRTSAVPEGAGQDWLAQHTVREALRLGIAAPAQVQLCGRVPSAWSKSDDKFACRVLGAASTESPAAQLAMLGGRA